MLALDSLVDPEDYPDNTQAQEVLEQFKARNNSVYMMRTLPTFRYRSATDRLAQMINPIMP